MSEYDTGWNDFAHGILNWTNPNASKRTWSIRIRTEVRTFLKQQPPVGDDKKRRYYEGVYEAADQYIKTGKIERR